ncbi:hypothetical protein B1B04_03795 [Lysinibacillus sp. KCTC 33748]|uniref:ETX/MTX2 family pore-forming toxin n=1 Tax=unclassified Lysinibacillus TaxID=2636778 RepID=UPI0009A66153|nr:MULTISPECIES: ETX/MTX2 family pore-forming toxin [unclassified Lysinibacillus]OXS76127.1 hypothetical protein B1B04_03795 [Lysinibacillus sp. KCTC 33748]SKB41055.1 toxin ETX/toxin MTX2 [Lysinibacillus sp. AC-3]
MKKKITKTLLCATMGISILTPLAVSAKTEDNNEQQLITQINQRENSFPNVGLGTQWLFQYYDKYLRANGLLRVAPVVTAEDLEVKNSYGQLAMEPQVISTTPLWAGQSDLENATDREQTLNSTEFRKTYTNTTTSSTEHGFMLGTETSLSTGIPFLAEGKITLKAEYNFNSTQTHESTETVEYVAPTQAIIVPPQTIARVTATLDVKKIKGKMDLHSEIGLNKEVYGSDKITMYHVFEGIKGSVSLGSIYDDAYKQAEKDGYSEIPEIKALSRSTNNPDYFLTSGVGNFESEYGSIFNVKVEFINIKTKKIDKTEHIVIQPKIKSLTD